MTTAIQQKKPNYLKKAFKSSGNYLVLFFSAMLCIVGFVNPLALIAIPVLEAIFLASKVSSQKFRASVDAEFQKVQKEAREAKANQILAKLSPDQRTAYLELKKLTDQSLACYAKLPSGGILLASSEAQLNGMLDLFLRLLDTLNGYRRYLSSTDLDALEKELAKLRTETSGLSLEEEEAPVNKIKKNRISMIEERIDRFQKARSGREIISHQLAAIDDFLRLFHDQALTIRDPDAATMQIENLTVQLAAGDESMRDLQNFSAVAESFSAAETMDSLPSIQTM